MALNWLQDLPGVTSEELVRGERIDARRDRAEQEIMQCDRDEAALYMELYHSRRWPAAEYGRIALTRLAWNVVAFLPAKMPPQRRKPRLTKTVK